MIRWRKGYTSPRGYRLSGGGRGTLVLGDTGYQVEEGDQVEELAVMGFKALV